MICLLREGSYLLTPEALTALVLLVVVTLPAAMWLRRRWWPERSLDRVWVAVLSVAVMLPLTLFREGLSLGWHPGQLADWSTSTLDSMLHGHWLSDSQVTLNILLGIPAGWCCTGLTRRPLLTIAGLSLFVLLIECTQAVTGAGANDVGDLVANCLGVALGAGIAAGLQRVLPLDDRKPSRPWLMPLFVVVAVVGAVIAARLAADSHQQSVRRELQDHLGGLTLDDVLQRVQSGDGEVLWGAADERADGSRSTEGRLEIRYPASFLGFQRCVFASWTADGVAFRDRSGDECTRFIDSDVYVDGEWVGH